MFNALGTPGHLQVIDYLQENGVPDMFVADGATEWVKDPAARPLVFGSSPNYTAEGLALGKWILDHKGASVKVGVLYENDDFGQEGLAGVRLALGTNVVSEEPYELTAPDVTPQIDRLHAANVDVIVSFQTPLLLAVGIRHARNDLGWNVQFAISAVSMNELTALVAGRDSIEGTVGPVNTYMAYQTSIPGVQAHHDLVTSSGTLGLGFTTPSVLSLYAQYVAEMMVETLQRAGPGLTRAGLVKAAESIKGWKCSACLFPVTLGPNDHDPAQSVAIGVYQGGRIVITDAGYSWEGVSVADLGPDTIKAIEVPADARNGS
jgi:ABC-type branched-subunit amino acid transport system substrate-binding protein